MTLSARHALNRLRGTPVPLIRALSAAICLWGAAGAGPARAATLNALLPEDVRRAGALTLATDPHYPPCEFRNGDDPTMVGFEPDLWNAVGERLGVRMQVVSTVFNGLIPGVQSGRYQLAMECISDSAVREQQVTFIDYAYATSAVYTRASNRGIGTEPLSLCGLKTAAQAGSDAIDSLDTISTHCTKNGRPALVILQFPGADTVFSALIAGRVDFVLNDEAAADEIARHLPIPVRTVTDVLLPRFYIGLIVLPQSAQLASAVLAALKAVQRDGTYARIMAKWHIDRLALEDAGRNLASARPLPMPRP